MKLVFLDAGFTAGKQVDSVWSAASAIILCSSIAGRLSIGYFSDRFPKKYVMTATYFIVAPNREQLVELGRLADRGELRPEIDSTFALARAQEAFDRLSARGKHGKVVFDVS